MDGKTHPRFQQQQTGIMGRLDFFGVALRIRLCRFQELPLFVWRKVAAEHMLSQAPEPCIVFSGIGQQPRHELF